MIIHRFADYAEQPWKNGQGVTREIARAALDDNADESAFLWRLSLADVGQSGPFSAFAGYDRTITLLAGDGFALAFSGAERHVLDKPSEPFDFDGGRDVHCTLLGGPSRDLNLMVRRDRAQADWRVLRGPGVHDLPAAGNADAVIVFCLTGTVGVHDGGGGGAEQLDRWDTALPDPGEAATLDIGPDSAAFCATVSWR
ncbi:MAG: HutD family protein [Rhodospirillales bacterium]